MSSASILRRHNLQNGIVLVVNQAARVVNFPLAQEVARHVRKLVVTLKAPKDNNMDAQELADRIGELLDFLDDAADETGGDPNILESAAGYLIELEQLRSNLHHSMSELRTLQEVGYTTRLASQTRIRDSIQYKETELMKAKFNVLMCLTMFTLTTGLQNTHVISQALHTVQALADTCEALHQRQERLERRGNAGSPRWETDERGMASVTCSVLQDRLLFFF